MIRKSVKRLSHATNAERLLAVLVAGDAVLPVDHDAVEIRKQPAFGLRQMQADGGRIPCARQKFPHIVHMGPRLVLWRELLERNERRRQRLRDDPPVVAGDSLLWHQHTPHRGESILSRTRIDRHQAVGRRPSYSTSRPADFTTFAHFSVSSAIKLPNWAGVPLMACH